MIFSFTTLSLVGIVLLFAASAAAHMQMSDPAPLNSSFNSHAVEPKDYSMTNPLVSNSPAGPVPGGYPCKGYLSLLGTPDGAPTAVWEAGSNQKFTLAGTAIHEGGSCQASISEDKGATFKVVKSYIGKCPVEGGGSFDFNVPKETKSGEMIFAWSWFNRVGNREMYMNCAVVTITNGGSGLHNYPDIFVANLDASCGTDEGFDVYFPEPGIPDRVVNLSTSSHPPNGACAPPKQETMAAISEPETTTTTTTYTLTKSSFTTTTSRPTNPQPSCECRCMEPGLKSGYVVNISPFTY
ncbi:hypothetical protein BGX38DRAFT_1089726 [Terfezia claveryi]|nr:hypothetical protein BGX38DRAFT_1089726 [Terfezia claveryi]